MNKQETQQYIELIQKEFNDQQEKIFLEYKDKKVNGWKVRKDKKSARYQAYTWCPDQKKTLRFWIQDMNTFEQETLQAGKVKPAKKKMKPEVLKLISEGKKDKEIIASTGCSPSYVRMIRTGKR